MGLFHYQIAVDLLSIYIKVSGFFGKNKSKKSIKGQKNWQKNLSNLNSDKKTFWIHAASHGEAIMASSLVIEILNHKNNLNTKKHKSWQDPYTNVTSNIALLLDQRDPKAIKIDSCGFPK